MTKDQKEKIDRIVIELYDKKHKYWNYYKKNVKLNHWDDLFITVVEALYKNPDSTCKAIDKNQHVFLATRITMNQWASSTSPYYKNFRLKDNNESLILNATESVEDLQDKEELEIKNQLVYEALTNLSLTFYEDQLIRMYYMERIHVKRIAKLHGISTNTVYANIVKVTDKLKQGIAHYLRANNWDSEYNEVAYDSDVVEKPRATHGKSIVWIEENGYLRKEFANIADAERVIGKKRGYLYAMLAPKGTTISRFKDGSYIEWGTKQKERDLI